MPISAASKCSLTEVPSDAILDGLASLLDSASVLGLASSGRHFRDLLHVDAPPTRGLWCRLCACRWRHGNFSPLGDNSGLAYRNPWLAEYRRRHLLDRDARTDLRALHDRDDDEGELVYALVRRGREILDLLRAWRPTEVPREIERGIVRYDICRRFRRLQDDAEGTTLEGGALLIARYCRADDFADPAFDDPSPEAYVERELDGLAAVLSARLERRAEGDRGTRAVLEEMRGFFRPPVEADAAADEEEEDWRSIFAGVEDPARPFVGNTSAYYTVGNSMLHEIMHRRTGIPITLAVVYAAIVRRATGLVLEPMGFPGHFMLAATVPEVRTGGEERVFVDAFAGGEVLTLGQVREMIEGGFGVALSPLFLRPVPHVEVWRRMLRNLMNCQDVSWRERSRINILMYFSTQDCDFQGLQLKKKQMIVRRLCR